MIKYKVKFDMDNNYQVTEIRIGEDIRAVTEEEIVYTGGLADCEAFIRLKEGGYME